MFKNVGHQYYLEFNIPTFPLGIQFDSYVFIKKSMKYTQTLT